ncbi:unnamed protein product [Symbiodinium microadriaticum]|nr:unnamed protein product [Symbiodinium microadriaticum]
MGPCCKLEAEGAQDSSILIETFALKMLFGLSTHVAVVARQLSTPIKGRCKATGQQQVLPQLYGDVAVSERHPAFTTRARWCAACSMLDKVLCLSCRKRSRERMSFCPGWATGLLFQSRLEVLTSNSEDIAAAVTSGALAVGIRSQPFLGARLTGSVRAFLSFAVTGVNVSLVSKDHSAASRAGGLGVFELSALKLLSMNSEARFGGKRLMKRFCKDGARSGDKTLRAVTAVPLRQEAPRALDQSKEGDAQIGMELDWGDLKGSEPAFETIHHFVVQRTTVRQMRWRGVQNPEHRLAADLHALLRRHVGLQKSDGTLLGLIVERLFRDELLELDTRSCQWPYCGCPARCAKQGTELLIRILVELNCHLREKTPATLVELLEPFNGESEMQRGQNWEDSLRQTSVLLAFARTAEMQAITQADIQDLVTGAVMYRDKSKSQAYCHGFSLGLAPGLAASLGLALTPAHPDVCEHSKPNALPKVVESDGLPGWNFEDGNMIARNRRPILQQKAALSKQKPHLA